MFTPEIVIDARHLKHLNIQDRMVARKHVGRSTNDLLNFMSEEEAWHLHCEVADANYKQFVYDF